MFPGCLCHPTTTPNEIGLGELQAETAWASQQCTAECPLTGTLPAAPLIGNVCGQAAFDRPEDLRPCLRTVEGKTSPSAQGGIGQAWWKLVYDPERQWAKGHCCTCHRGASQEQVE